MPIIDYQYTLKHTSRENISSSIKNFFYQCKNPQRQMELSSPIYYVNKIPSNVKIILVEGLLDTHVCSSQIEKFYIKLKQSSKNVQLVKWSVDHSFNDVENEFKDLVYSILN